MQLIPTKSDSTAGANGQLPASEYNDRNVEIEKSVTRSGQALNGAITDQLSKALFINSIGAATMVDSGSGNSITLNPITGGSGLVPPGDYAHFNGGRVLFDKATPNVGTAVTIAPWGLTAKPLVRKDLSLPLAGDVIGLCICRWDNAGDRWILVSNETDTYKYAVSGSGAIAPAFASNVYNIDLSGGNISISALPVPGFIGQRIQFIGEGAGVCDIAAGTGLLAISFNESEGISVVAVEKSGALQWELDIDRKRICKAWCTFLGTSVGTNPPIDGSNVATVTRISQAKYTVNFSNDLLDGNYGVLICVEGIRIYEYHTKTVSSVGINVWAQNGTLGPDPIEVTVTIFGS